MANLFVRSLVNRGLKFARTRLASVLTATAFLSAALPSEGLLHAADHSIELLRALQDRGYGDTAVMLLDRLEQQKKLPPEMVQTIDLEKSNSLRVAARSAYSAEASQKMLATAQQHLDKFLKEHPNHPEVAKATLSGADFLLDKAIEKLITAKNTTDKSEQAKLMAQAREQLDACGPKFDDAMKRYQALKTALADKLGTAQKTKSAPTVAQKKLFAERDRIEYGIVECRLKGAMLNYQIAQTYLDLKHADRKKALKQAYDEFDGIYYQYNGQGDIKLQAHFWKGRSIEELGDAKTAIDIYDEVLVMEPEGPNATIDSSPFYSMVMMYKLKLLGSRGKHDEVIAEADIWLTGHKNWGKTPGYQGIVLEAAKSMVAQSEKAKPADKTRLLGEIEKLLNTAVKIDSPYQNEIALLLSSLKKSSPTGPASTFEEHIAVGKRSGVSENWAEATVSFTKALELANKSKKAADIKEAEDLLSLVQLKIAYSLHTGGKLAECLELSKTIARAGKGENNAAAAGLALHCAFGLYNKAQDKAAALPEVQLNAKYLLDNWPGGSEADEARFMLASLEQQNGNIDAALKHLGEINPQSKRYGAAGGAAGQLYWVQFRKAKAEETPDATKLATFKKEAIDRLTRAIVELSKPGTDESLARTLFESQMLLSHIYMEEKQPADAVKLLEPLYIEIKTANPPRKIDDAIVRIFGAAAKAYIGVNDLTKAGSVAESLLEISTDEAKVNDVLINFAKIFDMEIRKAQAIEIENQGDFSATTAARATIDGCRKVQVKLIDGLSPRVELSPTSIIYLATTCQSLGMNKQARELYNKIVKMAADDPKVEAELGDKLTYVLSKLIGLLREEGKYEQAITEIDKLIAKKPRSLEPLVTKAEILQSWALKDPKKYDDCVDQWTTIRLKLQGAAKKPKEYYDAIYNAASCLVAQSKAMNDKTKANQAEKLLRSPLTLTPNLNGPDTVAKFNVLLKQAQQMQK